MGPGLGPDGTEPEPLLKVHSGGHQGLERQELGVRKAVGDQAWQEAGGRHVMGWGQIAGEQVAEPGGSGQAEAQGAGRKGKRQFGSNRKSLAPLLPLPVSPFPV